MTSLRPPSDPFNARDTFNTGSTVAGIYRLTKLEDAGLTRVAELPFSIRVLLESVLRNCDGREVTEDDVRNLAGWNAASLSPAAPPYDTRSRQSATTLLCDLGDRDSIGGAD